MNSDLRAVLSEHQLRATKPRLCIFDMLLHADTPLPITHIARACPDIDKASVYRTIETFTKIGITTAVAHGWKQHYELAAPFRPHHHHLHCTKCGKVIEISSNKVELVVDNIAKAYVFQPTGHTFEISGLCSACATPQAD